uniref:Retrovirus-related Pol polyprotein from transposon TNT 1-94 n=1 Tax=Tanacetum cinerariifolium TaxID=118510 RepID=A0A699JQ88_TANCI|nr:retrovirus-related Pol polyprotein from transposon TNT 1-94 [Tanacetum cinerariifolium]
MFVLPNDQMNSVINCLTAKSTWDDLILYHEGPSDVKESRVMDLKLFYNIFKFKEGESVTQTFTRYKALMNELVNDGIKILKLKINTSFINGLLKKWLSFCQSLRNTNNVKDSELASLFGKLKYEENLIDSIYETEKNKSLVSATPLSIAFFSSFIVQDFQDSPDDEEDTRSSYKYLNDLEEEYQARALLTKFKRFFNKGIQRFNIAKATDQTESHKCGKKGHFARDRWSKTSVSTYQSPFQPNPPKEEVSSDDNEMVEVKVLMALAEENDVVSKEGARNSELVKISMTKIHILLKMEDNDDRKVCLDYLCIDLNCVEEQRSNLWSKHRNLVHELNACKEQRLVLKQAKLNCLTMHHVKTKILKENKNLKTELKELKAITETWLTSSNKVNQCIREQILSLKKRILGDDQLTEDPSSSGLKDLDFIKSSADDTKVTITGFERPYIPLPPLKKLDGAKSISGPKTINSILRSKSTFKAKALKYVIINEPSSAPAKGNKSSAASKVHSTPADHLSNECLYYPICKLYGSYDHDTNGHNMIISLERKINPRNPQHAFKKCEACVIPNHTKTDHYDIELFKRGETLQAKKAEALKSTRVELSNANRSKTPTKRWVSKQTSHLNVFVKCDIKKSI